MPTELNTAKASPTGVLTHDGSGPGRSTAAQVRTLLNVEDGATADQSAAEIETAYNGQVAQVSAGEKTAGTATAVRRFSPKDVADMAGTHGGGGGGDSWGDAVNADIVPDADGTRDLGDGSTAFARSHVKAHFAPASSPVTFSSGGAALDLSGVTNPVQRIPVTNNATPIASVTMPNWSTGWPSGHELHVVVEITRGTADITITDPAGHANVTKLTGTINQTFGAGEDGELLFRSSDGVNWEYLGDPELTMEQIASSDRSGSDGTLITGTAGTNGNVAQWNTDGDLVDGPGVLDEDDMVSDSATNLATQQSIKAYVDNLVMPSTLPLNVTISGDGDYTLISDQNGAATITNATDIALDAGTATITFKIGATVIGGISVAATTTPSGDDAATSDNVMADGNSLIMTVAGSSGSPTQVTGSVHATRPVVQAT